MRSLVLDRSRIPLLVTAVLAAVALVVPYPGASFSVIVTRILSHFGSSVAGISYLSDGVLVLLAVGTVLILLRSWRVAPDGRPMVVIASLGVVLAYVVSEAAKLLFGQLRPCVRWPVAGECPVSDFSLPSNHATLAFAAVWVIAVATRRLSFTMIAAALALVVAIGRVLQGLHYVHDVAAGALVGLVVPALLTVVGIASERVRRRTRQR